MSQDNKEKLEKDLQKVFEFFVKNRTDMPASWTSAEIRKFIRWALYYRKMFIVWAPAGQGQRIVAIAVAWRTEKLGQQDHLLTFENTEFGNNLYVYQVTVHKDFERTGALFQLLSLALWRYPGVETVFWFPDTRKGQEHYALPTYRLLKLLALQAKPQRVRKYEGKDLPCHKKARDLAHPMFKFAR